MHCLCFNGNSLFAGTYGAGIFLSSDNGKSWSAASSGLTDLYIRTLVVCGTNLLAGTSTGKIFHSVNSGASWAAVDAGLTCGRVNCFATDGTNVFAGADSGVVLSRNSGLTWTPVGAGLPGASVRALAIIGSTLFAGTWGGGAWKRPMSEMLTSVQRKPYAVPSEYSLAQNYRNPFNPSTKIGFSLPALPAGRQAATISR